MSDPYAEHLLDSSFSYYQFTVTALFAAGNFGLGFHGSYLPPRDPSTLDEKDLVVQGSRDLFGGGMPVQHIVRSC